jgi:hypothetical protein
MPFWYFNAVLVLMFTTAILGPVLTERFASRLSAIAGPGASKIDHARTSRNCIARAAHFRQRGRKQAS